MQPTEFPLYEKALLTANLRSRQCLIYTKDLRSRELRFRRSLHAGKVDLYLKISGGIENKMQTFGGAFAVIYSTPCSDIPQTVHRETCMTHNCFVHDHMS